MAARLTKIRSASRSILSVFCLLLIFGNGFCAEGRGATADSGVSLPQRRSPRAEENLVNLIGMSVTELFDNFGPPAAVYASRGIETWQDDVVFEYPGVDFYIYKDRVWQLNLEAGGGISTGDPRAAVLLVLGDTARDKGSHILGRLRNTSWPIEWRFNIEGGKVSAIYLYRTDY
ncbi:MAG: hypothetical protein LBH18_01235 [Spirochaetaceae bacterium]|jgi:hypothetical protein|nr:hypothetical protein [Spirochaetaceae bacterium]